MQDPFASPKLLVADARQRIRELELLLHGFFEGQPHEGRMDTDPETGDHLYKMILHEPVPTTFTIPVFHCLNDLRSALDHAVHSSVFMLTGVDSDKSRFPFAKSPDELESRLADRKGNFREIPSDIKALLSSLKPYNGGDEDLRALNDMRNRKIHRYLVPTIAKGFAMLTGGAPTGYSRNADGMVGAEWDFGEGITVSADTFGPDKNEIIFARAPAALYGHYEIQVTIEVAFDQGVAAWGGTPILNVLRGITDKVAGIVDQIEAETVRIKAASSS